MLAVADAFIVAIAGLISNFILTALNDGVTNHSLLITLIVSVITCFGGLFIFGAYNKLWRYFNSKDYLSCVNGVLTGIAVSCAFIFILHNEVHLRFTVLHTSLIIIGICAFRLIFKTTFIELTNVGKAEAKYKRTMMIGGGQACRMLLKEITVKQLLQPWHD